jgi:type I restriction enzyme, S subunit
MTYAAYESYAPSESVWLDQLPTHWQQLRVKHVIESMESGVSVNSDASPATAEEIGVLKTSCVYGDQFSPNENKRVLDDELGRIACHVKAERLIVSRMNTPELVGSCGYVERDFPNLFLPDRLWQTVFNKSRECLPRFAWYYLTSRPAKSAVSSLAAGTSGSMQNIGQDAFVGISFPLPPLDEQQTIARFLDAKTAQIDTLVAQKRQLIAKLKEKRSALIARTVTRGLPPEAAKTAGLEPAPAMKDSGVEWLKEIPLHWKLSPLKRIVSTPITDGPHETPEFLLEGVPFASAEAVQDGRVQLSSVRGCISRDDHEKYSRKYRPKRDDIFVVKSGSTTGKVAIVDFDEEFNVWSPLAAIRCDLTKALPAFVFYALSSEYFQGLVQVSWSFGTQPNIGMGVIGNLAVVLPPPAEQNHIAAFLNSEVARIERLMERAYSAISRLTEYRQALITSAVTGKIDVRELAP